jgi:voltage-gated potassium channel
MIARIKTYVRTMLEDENAISFEIFTTVLALATMLVIIASASESVPFFLYYKKFFLEIEWFVVLLFALEYGARIWIAQEKRKYIFSYLGVADLFAILPTFMGIGALSFLKTIRLVRATQIIHLVGRTNISHVRRKSEEIYKSFNLTLFSTVIIFLLFTGACFYLYAFVQEIGFMDAFSDFLGAKPIREMNKPVAVLFILGRVAGILCIGFIVGYMLERVNRR